MMQHKMHALPDLSRIKADFPIFQAKNRGQPLIYLDTAASGQKPKQVIAAIHDFYQHQYANIHRGIYELSELATKAYQAARVAVKSFINAASAQEIIFVKGTTEGINLVAQSFGRARWQAGDEVILSTMEHHANIVPWYLLAQQLGVVLKVIPISDRGELDMDAYAQLFTPRTQLVALSHVSNVLGTINPVAQCTAIAHAHQVPILLDGAQAIAHLPVDVQALDCDFYAFSGHKLYGPTGIGVLYGKKKYLDSMPPYQGGGGMIESVTFEQIRFAKGCQQFEAGTPDIAAVLGLHAALDYLSDIGFAAITAHEKALIAYTEAALRTVKGLRLIGTAPDKVGVFSFVIDGVHPHDIGSILDQQGVAIRAGHHCAMPLMTRYQLPATARASLGIYNSQADIEALMAGIALAVRMFS